MPLRRVLWSKKLTPFRQRPKDTSGMLHVRQGIKPSLLMSEKCIWDVSCGTGNMAPSANTRKMFSECLEEGVRSAQLAPKVFERGRQFGHFSVHAALLGYASFQQSSNGQKSIFYRFSPPSAHRDQAYKTAMPCRRLRSSFSVSFAQVIARYKQ